MRIIRLTYKSAPNRKIDVNVSASPTGGAFFMPIKLPTQAINKGGTHGREHQPHERRECGGQQWNRHSRDRERLPDRVLVQQN